MTFNFEPTDGMANDFVSNRRELSTFVQNSQKSRGFTLIEFIGVLAVISILAMVLAPVLIRQMDRIFSENEAKQLEAFADGYRQYILTTKSIPGGTTWTNVIATQLGVSSRQVLLNDRRVERRFLVDPAFTLFPHSATAGPPPYTQDRFGSTNEPVSPRVMILSSISKPLPTNIVNGLAASTGPYSFTNIWNSVEDTTPAGWVWDGRVDDLKVQRIHLADLFVELTLNQEDGDPALWGLYSIEAEKGACLRTPFSAYYINGSLLGLYDQTTQIPQYTEMLQRSKSFTSSKGTWRQGDDFWNRAIARPTAYDMQLAANFFRAAAQNPWADGYPQPSSPQANRETVYNAMTNYMRQYVVWRQNNPTAVSAPNNGPLADAQAAVAASTLALRDPRL